jgi:DNA-binding transcriptional LysR family regulator
LRQIGVFVAVARHESVSRAAETLALSQSATSTALAELERQYDTQLFDRFGKTLRLNELGQALLPQAVELIERAAAIENVLEGRAGYGLLRIGATLTIGNYLATLIVADFLKRHPESTAAVAVHNTATIIEQLARHELDLGLIEGSCRHPDLVVEPWVADELVVFCAPAHPLARRGSATLAELAGEAWIVREPGSGTRETLDQALRHHHSAAERPPGTRAYRGDQARRRVRPRHRLHFAPGAARGLPARQPGGDRNARARPAAPFSVPLAAAQVPDRGHARVHRPVPRDDGGHRERSDQIEWSFIP